MNYFKMFRKVLFKIILEFIIIVTACIIAILLPIGVVLLLPFGIYRFTVYTLSKFFKPDLVMLSARSSIFTFDKIYEKPLSSVVSISTIEGDVKLETFRESFKKNVLELKAEDGNILYPEMRQSFVEWMGFGFLKADPNFKVEHYVNDWDGNLKGNEYEAADEEKLKSLVRHLLISPFRAESSVWDVVLVRNYRPRFADPEKMYTAFIFRIHHRLADGYSIMKIILTDLYGTSIESLSQPNYVKRNKCTQVLHSLSSVVLYPYEIATMLITTYDCNKWLQNSSNFNKTYNIASSDHYPLELLKEIRSVHKVSMVSVLSAGIAGGIRNFMLKKKWKVPSNIHCAMPIPIPGHPKKLCNHMSIAIFALPMGKADSVTKLKSINRNLEKLRHQVAPMMNFYFQPLLGWIPIPLANLFPFLGAVTVAFMNIPGPQTVSLFEGHKLLDFTYGLGFGPTALGLGFTSFGQAGIIKLALAIDTAIFPDGEPAEELMKFVMEEFETLRKQDVVV